MRRASILTRYGESELELPKSALTIHAASEVVLLTDATWPFLSIGALPLEELGHLLAFGGLGLLAMAVFRDD